jgi:sulfite exporter TauE/SafE
VDPLLAIASGLVAGAASAPHCLGMCGPLAVFAAGSAPTRDHARIARHQLGRLLAYAALGAVAGGSGGAIVRALAPGWVSLALAILLAIGMSIAAIRLVRPARAAARPLSIGTRPRTPLVVRVLGRLPREPMLIGALSALLPCGALYAALVIAASAGTSAIGAATMAAFAVTSGIGLLAAGWIARRASSPRARHTIAALLAVGAMIVVARPVAQALQRDAEAPPACHGP